MATNDLLSCGDDPLDRSPALRRLLAFVLQTKPAGETAKKLVLLGSAAVFSI